MVYRNERRETASASLIVKKDAVIPNLEATSANTKLYIENLNSELENLTSGESKVKYLVSILENLYSEKTSVQLSADTLSEKLVSSEQEVKKLDEFVHSLGAEVAEMDKKNLTFMENFDKLSGLYDTFFMLLQKDRDHAKRSFAQLQAELSRATAEKDALESAGNKLNEKIVELHNDKESLICQLSGIRCPASQTIDQLDSEAKKSVLKNAEAESVISKLKEETQTLLERLKTSEDKKQELASKLSSIQMENKEKSKRFQADALRQSEKLATLQKESESHQLLQADLLAKEVNQPQTVIEDRVHLIHHLELIQNEIHAENELKELKAFKCQYEDDCKKLQEELDLQRKKEEGQTALLQIQWEVMSENQAEEQEVDSYKLHSASKDSCLGGSKRNEHIRVRAETEEEQEPPFVKVTATPASKTLKKVQKAAHCEYKVQTNNGRVTKRRKTVNKAMPKRPLMQSQYLNILHRLNLSTCKPSCPRGDLSVFDFGDDDHTCEAHMSKTHMADHTSEAHMASSSEGTALDDDGEHSSDWKDEPIFSKDYHYDYYSFSRSDLQFHCKLHKIPANMTNKAMADALRYREIGEAIDEYNNLRSTPSSTPSSHRSKGPVDVRHLKSSEEKSCGVDDSGIHYDIMTENAFKDTKMEGGGRRSTRIKSRPLEYWRGERFLYGRIDENMPTIVGIKYGSPGEDRSALKVKSFVSEEYKEVVDFAALH